MSDCKSSSPLDGAFASSVVSASLDLLLSLVDLWRDLPAAKEMFSTLERQFLPALQNALKTEGKKVHGSIKEKAGELATKLDGLSSQRQPLPSPLDKAKPKMLKLYEPEVEDK